MELGSILRLFPLMRRISRFGSPLPRFDGILPDRSFILSSIFLNDDILKIPAGILPVKLLSASSSSTNSERLLISSGISPAKDIKTQESRLAMECWTWDL